MLFFLVIIYKKKKMKNLKYLMHIYILRNNSQILVTKYVIILYISGALTALFLPPINHSSMKT